jgi:hypothetical protein
MRFKSVMFMLIALLALGISMSVSAGPPASTGPNWGPFEQHQRCQAG